MTRFGSYTALIRALAEHVGWLVKMNVCLEHHGSISICSCFRLCFGAVSVLFSAFLIVKFLFIEFILTPDILGSNLVFIFVRFILSRLS